MDIKEIKEDIKKEEEFLVKVFQLEKFVRKYKWPIIIFVAVFVVGLIGFNIYNYLKEKEAQKANILLEKVLNNPNDKKALAELKKTKLYDLYLLKKGEYSKINSIELQDIKAYKLAMQKGDIKSLEEYLNNPNYHLLKNAVRVSLIRLYLQKGDRKKALLLAQEIPQDSQFKQFAIYLIHYGIVK